MGVLEALRRFSRIPPPQVVELPEEELSWPVLKARWLAIPVIEPPEVRPDFALTPPDTSEITGLHEPAIVEPESYLFLPPVQILDLLDPLAKPVAHGTIYVKKEEQLRLWGQPHTKTRVEPIGLRERLERKEPKGLDIFEMLLPILMPPAATEFREELLFPQELYPFQRAGVKWLFENESALLADDMGLGKTVQAITAFRALIRRSLALQALVICPKSVLTNWMRELQRWAPELVAIRIHGNQETRRIAWRAYMGKCHVLVTTYETVRQDRESIKGRVFDLVVADEVQKIKNPGTAASQAVRNLQARRRWALSGTPMENSVDDLVAVFGFVKPGLFQTSEITTWRRMPFSGLPRVVRDRVRPHLLRRRKEDLREELKLSPKVVDTKLLELTESQRQTYDQVERQGVDDLRMASDVTIQHVFALIQKLKQTCNFDTKTGESAKMEFLLEDYLPQACSGDQKALVFSQYVKTLEELAKRIGDYNPLVYTGQLSTAQRSKVEESFSSRDEHKVLLLSLRAGGLGLNLTRANYVLHFDRWWNPAVERQAEDRVDRFGQERMVYATRLICSDTIEERIDKILDGKKIRFQEVVDELADVSLERVLSEEELFGLFGLTPPRRAREGPPEAAREAVAQPAAAEQRAAIVIRPEEPFSNVVRLRGILRESEEFIWWADLHFHARALEELIVSVDPAVVREVRILSGPANVDDRAWRDFARFRQEVAQKGIRAEWRVLSGFAHDRFIMGKNACYNVPPVNSLLRGSYGEILETPNRPPFEEWWARAVPIEQGAVG